MPDYAHLMRHPNRIDYEDAVLSVLESPEELAVLFGYFTSGSEQGGRRPAVILSGNMMNTHLSVVIVCPLTTKIKGYKGNVVLQPNAANGLLEPSEILAFHVRSVDKKRLKNRMGEISKLELEEIKSALNDILRY